MCWRYHCKNGDLLLEPRGGSIGVHDNKVIVLLGGIVREHGELLLQGAVIGVHGKLIMLLLVGII
jgi:hypothetical protein